MKDAYAKATKLSLSIDLRAPDIIVPVSSTSYHALEIDLGHLALTNSFITLDIRNEKGYPAVVDEMKMKLTNLKIQRIEMDVNRKVLKHCDILEPVTFTVTVRRNLSSAWYEAIPDLGISGQIQTIKLLLSQADYQMIMCILSENMAEGQQPAPPAQNIPSTTSKTTTVISEVALNPSIEEVEEEAQVQLKVDEEKIHIFLKFTFTMESFVINLFTGAAKTVSCTFVENVFFTFLHCRIYQFLSRESQNWPLEDFR